MRPCLEKYPTQKGLVEWFKVKALSLSPSTAKKEEKKKRPIVTQKLGILKTSHASVHGSGEVAAAVKAPLG
jgi:hypothetical protein